MNHDDYPAGLGPAPVRLNFFQGQMLSADDFRTEQDYFLFLQRLANRMLEGHGVAYGLDVTLGEVQLDGCPVGPEGRTALEIQTEIARLEHRRRVLLQTGCDGEAAAVLDEIAAERALLEGLGGDAAPAPAVVSGIVVHPGYALDCHGHELIVPERVAINPFLADEDGVSPVDMIEGDTGWLLLSLCYAEEPLFPTRPVGGDACAAPGPVEFARIRQTTRLKLSPATADERMRRHRAEPCMRAEGCDCGCVALALIQVVKGVEGWSIRRIDRAVRRPLALYQPTRIVGISWYHGWTYAYDKTPNLLHRPDAETGGLTIYFSRPVLPGTVIPGVAELQVTAGGGGQVGSRRTIPTTVHLAADGLSLRVHQTSLERFNDGDRITLTLHTSHLLDKCGRPVAGANIGGLVPPRDDREGREMAELPVDRALRPEDVSIEAIRHFQPWETGVGGPLISWIFVGENEPLNPGGPDEV